MASCLQHLVGHTGTRPGTCPPPAADLRGGWGCQSVVLPRRKANCWAPSRNSSARVCAVLQPQSRPQTADFPPSLGVLSESPSNPDLAPNTLLTRDTWRVVPDIWKTAVEEFPEEVALFDPHRPGQPKLTYKELYDNIALFSEGLRALGLKKGESVALLAENSHRWIIADQGVMRCGACNAVRGTRSSARELQYIVAHSDSVGVIVETEEVLEKLRPMLEDEEKSKGIKFAAVLWPAAEGASGSHTSGQGGSEFRFRFPVVSFSRVVEEGRSRMLTPELLDPEVDIREDDIATLVFTSGTTGDPKAVMLTHANLMHQVRAYSRVLPMTTGSVLLSLLPPWHMYERSCEYFALSRGAQQIYSGVKSFKEDLTKYPPDVFVAVPLVFEVLYNGVQRKLASASATRAAIAKNLIAASLLFMDSLRKWRGLGLPRTRGDAQGDAEESWLKASADVVISGALALLLWPLHKLASKLVYSQVQAAIPIRQVAVSGGGSLSPHVDKFFEAVGVSLLNGYGLTETAPVLAVRRPHRNVLGSVGMPIEDTQIKVVDPVSGATLADGVKGVVKGKGPQVMKGYYKNPGATAAVLDSEGWFDTGDLGWISQETKHGPARNSGRQLVLEGRAKDTIVLANGENVEPAWVEEAVLQSPAVAQIMLIGQDQRRLSALIVPSEEEVTSLVLKRRAAREGSATQPITQGEKEGVIREEINRCLDAAGCGVNERIGNFALLEEPFSVENGLLTPTMKMRRDVVYQTYSTLCESLMHT